MAPENPNASLLTSQEAGLTSKPPEKDIVLNSSAFQPFRCNMWPFDTITMYALTSLV